MSRESIINILVVSFPAQGHLNPMVQFCTHLATKGVKVTLVLTERASKSLQTPAGTASLIEVELIPDVLPEGVAEVPYNMETVIAHLRASFSVGLPEVIEKRKTSPGRTPRAVLYDSVVPWILELAKGSGLEGAALFTQPCCVSAFYYHVFKGDAGVPPENLATAVVSLPGMPPMGANDLPSFSYFKDDSQLVQSLVANQFVNIEQVDWIFFNTFDKLEEEILKWMRSKWAVKTIGPLIPPMYLTDSKEEDHRISLFNKPLSQACMDWLSTRHPNSVVYVSFGSLACVTQEQMAEFATALAETNHSFLWVVRESEETKLPKDFKSETSEKGLIVKWCPQLQVLSHGTIACFMTHCGWNSAMEALMLGVPMIVVPQWGDQQMNAKYVVDVWETGVRPKANQKGIVTKEEIKGCIREVMEEEKGKGLKRNALKWKGLADEALLEGGSSHSTIEHFISHLSSI